MVGAMCFSIEADIVTGIGVSGVDRSRLPAMSSLVVLGFDPGTV